MLVSDSFSDRITMTTVNRNIYFYKTSSGNSLWSPSDRMRCKQSRGTTCCVELIE